MSTVSRSRWDIVGVILRNGLDSTLVVNDIRYSGKYSARLALEELTWRSANGLRPTGCSFNRREHMRDTNVCDHNIMI